MALEWGGGEGEVYHGRWNSLGTYVLVVRLAKLIPDTTFSECGFCTSI